MLFAWSRRFSIGVVLILPLIASGCGGGGGGDATPAAAAASAGAPDPTPADSGGSTDTAAEPVTIDDACAIVSADAVSEVLGITVTAVPRSQCIYAGATLADGSATINYLPSIGGTVAVDAARKGVELAVSAAARSIDVQGSPGYVITGKLSGLDTTIAGTATGRLLITVTLVGGALATDAEAAARLLELALAGVAAR